MNTRKTHLDILRVVACLFVIATHFGFGYSVYQSKTAGSMPYWISLAISISCTLYYVPILKAISGGFSAIISAVVSSIIVALIFPIKLDENDAENSTGSVKEKLL